MMSKVTDYTLVVGENEESVINEVKNHMKEGWQPIGGIAVVFIEKIFKDVPDGDDPLWETNCEYTQAMVKMV